MLLSLLLRFVCKSLPHPPYVFLGLCIRVKVVQAERDLEHLRSQLRRSVATRKRHEERGYSARSRAKLLGTDDGAGGGVM